MLLCITTRLFALHLELLVVQDVGAMLLAEVRTTLVGGDDEAAVVLDELLRLRIQLPDLSVELREHRI